MMMEENVISRLPSMTNMNILSDISADFCKAASLEPADVARVEFVVYEAMKRRQVSSIGVSVSARCLELYP